MPILQATHNLPQGVTEVQFLSIIWFEIFLFALLLGITIAGIKNYQRKRTILRLNVVGICIGYTLVLIMLVLPQLFRWFDYPPNVDPTIVDALFLEFQEVLIIVTSILFWVFYVEVFVESRAVKIKYDVSYILIGAAIILLNFLLPAVVASYVFLLLSLILTLFVYFKIMGASRRLVRKFDKGADRSSMQLLFTVALFLTLSYILTYSYSAMQQYGLVPMYSTLYVIANIFGFTPFILLYVAFFQPPWFKLRVITPADLPLLDSGIHSTTIDDELPQLTEGEMNAAKDSFEWWYFDVKSPKGSSLVLIFKRKDPVIDPTRPSIHIEYESEGVKFNRVKAMALEEGECEFTSSSVECTIRIGANTIIIKKDDNNNPSQYQLHVDIGDFVADFSFQSVHYGFKQGPNGCYFVHKLNPEINTHAAFTAPRIHGTGSVTLNGITEEIEGDGYHDHPWGTAQLLLTNGEWHWGRLYTDQVSILFADVKPSKVFYGGLKVFMFGTPDDPVPRVSSEFEIEATNWKKNSAFGLKFPHGLVVSIPTIGRLAMSYQKPLLVNPVYIRSEVNFTLTNVEGEVPEAAGGGWLEYFKIPYTLRGLLTRLNRIVMRKWQKG